MPVTLDWKSATFVPSGKKNKVLTVASMVARNANEAMVALWWGLADMRLERFWNQAVGFVLVRLAVVVMTSSH
jgi:hypothetical protein